MCVCVCVGASACGDALVCVHASMCVRVYVCVPALRTGLSEAGMWCTDLGPTRLPLNIRPAGRLAVSEAATEVSADQDVDERVNAAGGVAEAH
jgi:hypothetical protein